MESGKNCKREGEGKMNELMHEHMHKQSHTKEVK